MGQARVPARATIPARRYPYKIYVNFVNPMNPNLSRKVLHSRLPQYIFAYTVDFLIFEPDAKALRCARHLQDTDGGRV